MGDSYSPIPFKDVIFDLQLPIGEGKFGTVHAGVWNGTNVAVKVIRTTTEFTSENQQQLIKDVEPLIHLKHDNLISVFGVAIDYESFMEDIPMLVLEFADEGSLYSQLCSNPEKITGPDAVNNLLYQIAKGMAYLHEQQPPIIHGDLRTANCLLKTNNFGTVLKLTDFGLSRSLFSQLLETDGDEVLERVRWMAPERISDDKVTKMVDVYAFSMTAYEILSVGKLPFELNQVSDIREISSAIQKNLRPERPPPSQPTIFVDNQWELIRRCWNQEQMLRPTFTEILEILETMDIERCDEQQRGIPETLKPEIRMSLMTSSEGDGSTLHNRLSVLESTMKTSLGKSKEALSIFDEETTESYGEVIPIPIPIEIPQNPKLNGNSGYNAFLDKAPTVLSDHLKSKVSFFKTKKGRLAIFFMILGVLVIAAGIVVAIVFSRPNVNQPNNTPLGQIIKRYNGHTSRVWSLSVIGGNSPRMFSGSSDSTIREWDLNTGSTVRTYSGHSDGIYSVMAIPGTPPRLFSGSGDHSVKEWDTTNGQTIRTFVGHNKTVQSVAVLQSNPPRLFSGSWDNLTIEWDLFTGQPVKNFTGHTDSVLSIALLEKPPRLFSTSSPLDATVREWDLNTTQNIRTYSGHSGYVEYVLVVPGTPNRLFSCAFDKTIREWNMSTGEPIRVFYGHSNAVFSLAAIPGNPPRLFSGSADNTIREWDVKTGETVRIFNGHTDYVRTLTVLNGNPPRLFSGSFDNSIIEWAI
ncbi:hypothetical protein HK098_004176 [Nowakowskiella sp. JEL0407]|nr:hypothetical protein HK098_004176 [Nowakowskiella sp. JEL0407]